MPALTETELVGKKESIADMLLINNAGETPFFSQIKKGARPGNSLFGWPVDKYNTPDSTSWPEGKDVVDVSNRQKNRALLYGRTHRFLETYGVTVEAQEVTDQYGDSGDKLAQSQKKATEELFYKIETVLLGTQDSAEGDASSGSVTRGMGSWISSTAQADTATAVPTAYLTPSGQIFTSAITAFNEDALRALLQARWENIRNKGDLKGFVGSNVKNAISDFIRYEANVNNYTVVRRFDGGSGSTFGSTVDIYKGDYGTVAIFLDSFMPTQKTGYFVDMNRVELRPAVALRAKRLPENSSGPKGYVEQISALECTDPQSHIRVTAS